MTLTPKVIVRRLWHRWLRMTGRRTVYIDCGANVGEVLEEKVRKYPAREYIAFEANPDLIPQIQAVKARHPKTSIQVLNKAVWTEDSTVDFFLSKENSAGELRTDGSTLVPGKVAVHPGTGEVDYQHPVRVESVDFGKWITSHFSPRDYIWLKMDVEGAEYAVLEKMVEDQSIRYINKAYVEFHYNEAGQLQSISKERHDTVRAKVRQHTKLIEWH